ncbi:MAG TPA: multicopper oxidase domain-containing protein [Anaerolineales bacterium]|nr:multicopper oxidase domain-containing protein [Anaerolineales bacterium]
MLSRRSFLKVGAVTAGGLAVTILIDGKLYRVFAQIPGGSLDPMVVPKYAIPLLIPPVMPRAGTIKQTNGKNIDYYEISMKQFAQQILPADLPTTTVWGYGAVKSASKKGLLIHNAPSLTIESKWARPVRVKWINDLVDATGDYLPHLLPVDQTLHWANPPGGTAGRDTRPVFTSTPGPYTGPVPIVTHVHGAVGVGDESDGYAEAWYLPVAANIPASYATKGTWYDFFAGKALASYGEAWGPGYATFQYPNANRASTIWYHDHALGMTRLNVYAGPAGFYIIRGGPDGDDAVIDSRFGTPAVLPGPAPKEGDKFPPNKTYYEIPIAIQDRSFNVDGSLFYPDTRAFFDGITGPYIPETDISPIWNPEFFGNMIMVNGNTWPFQTVEQRRYRLRFLNGCQSRFLILDFNSIPGIDVWQIGNEGGFLAAPVNLTASNGNRLLMGLAERADLIVDFTNVPLGNSVLANVGPDEPFGGGVPGVDFMPADPNSTGQVMEFRVVPSPAPDPTTPPQFLQLPAITPLPPATVTRPLALLEEMSTFFEDSPAEALLGTVAGDPNVAPGVWTKRLWMEPVTENPAVGATEVWELYNATGDAHPMHVHEVVFEVIDRQDIFVDEETMEMQVVPGSVPVPPELWETGFKDTVIAYPGQVTRIRAQFNTPGQFVWHCHIVEHEDNEMMRPYRIGSVQPGQPM